MTTFASASGTTFFFNAQTTDANSTGYSFTPPNKRILVKAWGTWGGASITFQSLAPGTAGSPVWINVPNNSNTAVSFTANGQAFINIVYGEVIRAVQSGSTSTSLTVSAEMY